VFLVDDQTSEQRKSRIAAPSHEADLFSSPSVASSLSSSLQSFSSWWSATPSVSTVKSAVLPESLTSSVDYAMRWSPRQPKAPVEKKYISREKQLEKLRQRLDQERKADGRAYFAVDVCGSCGPAKVHL